MGLSNLGTVDVALFLASEIGYSVNSDSSTVGSSVTPVPFSCILSLYSSSSFSPSSSSSPTSTSSTSELISMVTSLFSSCASAISSTTETILFVASGTLVSYFLLVPQLLLYDLLRLFFRN